MFMHTVIHIMVLWLWKIKQYSLNDFLTIGMYMYCIG